MIAMNKIVDRELALEQVGGNAELAEELFRMLLVDLATRTEIIKGALVRGDHDTIRAEVHSINGATAYCGVPALRSVAQELDRRFKGGDFSDLEAGLDTLFYEISRIMAIKSPLA